MDIDHLVVETRPALEDVRFLEDRLYEYNATQTRVDDGQWLAIFVRDDQQVMRTGIAGWTWCGSCYIRSLCVHETCRGQGYGTKLLQTAEHEAVARGCRHMGLNSYSFQAPGFYQKLSYEVFAVLDEHPRHHRNYYLHKRLP